MDRIVWADGSATDRFLIEEACREAGAGGVRFVSDGEEALEAVRRERPALVVLELEMPGMDGVEALRRLRADAATRTIPVVFFTGLGQAPEACSRLGYSGLVQKATGWDAFAAQVRHVLQFSPIEVHA